MNGEGVEVAGGGPETTQSYQDKVQKALEILDPNIARWWKSNSVNGQIRSRAASWWQSNHHSWVAGDGQPVVEVDQNFTAGQTAQAIIDEVKGGWFADSIGVFYKQHRIAQTGDAKEFKIWQQGAKSEAARLASTLAELYVNSIATLTPAGDLVVTLGDLAENGPRWDQLLSALPLLGHLPVGAIVLKVGKREVKLPKQLTREFEALSAEDRKGLLAFAATARTDEEAAASIKRGIAAAREPEHHIATNKNWVSTLRGGPWSPKLEKLFKKAGLTLDDVANKVRIPGHVGPHPEEYHQEIYDRLTRAIQGKRGTAYREALLEELRTIASEARTSGSRLNRLLTK